MAFTYSKLAEVTVGSGGSATIAFNNIPQNYTDLKIVFSARQDTGAARATYISFNGSSTGFTGRYLYGDGASAASGTLAQYIGSTPGGNFTASTFSNSEVYIPNYSGSNNKSYSADNVDENNATANDMNFVAGLWSNVTAISSIAITTVGNFVQYSTATLYGVKAEV